MENIKNEDQNIEEVVEEVKAEENVKVDDTNLEVLVEEEENMEDLKNEAMVEENSINIRVTEGGFFSKLVSYILDEAIIIGISALVMIIFNELLNLFGFRIAENYHSDILIIIFFIMNSLYYPIFEIKKFGRSIGKRVMNII